MTAHDLNRLAAAIATLGPPALPDLINPPLAIPAFGRPLEDLMRDAQTKGVPDADAMACLAMCIGYGIGNSKDNSPVAHDIAVAHAINAIRWAADDARAKRINGRAA